MTNLRNVHFDSNLMREPSVFVSLGKNVAAICRDILIWAAAQQSKDWLALEVPRFCEMFGYNRQLLLRALPGTEQEPGPERKEMTKAKFWIDEATKKTSAKNVMDYALFSMIRKNLLFEDGYSAIDEDGTLTTYNSSSPVNLLGGARVKRSKKGTVYYIKLHPLFVNNCSGGHYTTFRLSDYLNLRTATGAAWEPGRRLFLRLVWKAARIEYEERKPKKERKKGIRSEEYLILKEAAGLGCTEEKANAARLRTMIKDVVKLGNLKTVPVVELVQKYGEDPYQVHMRKHSAAAV